MTYQRRTPFWLLASLLPFCFCLSAFAQTEKVSQSWLMTAPDKLAPVTVRWEDPAQSEVFIVEGERYQCRVATNPARILSLTVAGKNLLGAEGAQILVADAQGKRYQPASRESKPNWKVWRREWVPAQNARARMNVWNAGPYYWDAHLLDIPLVPVDQPGALPLRGEIVFHAHPDELRIEVRVNDGGEAAPSGMAKTALLLTGVEIPPQEGTGLQRASLRVAGAAVLGDRQATFGTDGVWSAPLAKSAVWVVRPAEANVPLTTVFAEDFEPLPESAAVVQGGAFLGFDAASGLYRVQAANQNGGAFSFEQAYQNPQRRLKIQITLKNGRRTRRLNFICQTQIGNLEAAVLTDSFGFPLPVPAQVSKNFSGEREEPDDSAYGDAYFPVVLEAGETRSLTVALVNQNWGNHPLKQVSSVRFFNIYWHLSTGASETTCFTHNWMQIGRSGILHIPDFRPLSGPFWEGQPQHDCLQWPGFLQYNNAQGRLVYERTVFDSVSPNLARFTMQYHTSDNAVRATLGVMEVPQSDEMRTFVHLRYDVQKPVTIEGDARLNFRILNLFEKQTPASLSWTDAAGKVQTRSVTKNDLPMLTGEPMTGESPFVSSQAAEFTGEAQADARKANYHCVVLVRSFTARLNGKDFKEPALSAQFDAKNGSYWLTVPAEKLTLQPGDFVDAEVMLMPHSGPAVVAQKPVEERANRFGAGVPMMAVSVGEKKADFPATVRANGEVASVILTGGFDRMPLLVEGFEDWGVPLLWRGEVWQNPQSENGDGYQVTADGSGGYRFTFVYPVRFGQKVPLTVTRVASTTGVAKVSEENGAVVLEAPKAGTFTLKAPVLFAPGANTLSANSNIVSFTGKGERVHSVPVSVRVPQGRAVVVLSASGMEAKVTGAVVTLTFNALVRGASYRVTVNGVETIQTATNGSLGVTTVTPEATVRVEREGTH